MILYCVDVSADGSSQRKHIDSLMEYLHELITTPDFDVTLNTTNVGGGDSTVAEYLRLFAHLVIFLRDLGLIPRREVCVAIWATGVSGSDLTISLTHISLANTL